jgi:hypothetical protein
MMRKPIYLIAFIVTAAFAVAAQQTTNSNPAKQNPNPPVTSTTPATQVGSGAQTSAGTPAPADQAPVSANQAPVGGVSGTTSSTAASSAAQTPDVQGSVRGVGDLSDADLQSQIQNALSKEPTLTGNSAHVTVGGDTIDLAGSVATGKEKVTATRIVQSYAGSKKVVNHLTINGRTGKTAPAAENPDSKPPKANPKP